MRAFLEAMAEFVPEDERILISSVPGDPQASAGEMWNVRPWRFGDKEPPAAANNYVCVSAFKRGVNGWRRTADQFGRAVAFMVDDVGTKVQPEALRGMVASAVVRTSPGNEQHWFFLNPPINNYETFSRLISAFVQQRLGGSDPGMGGANRVGRLPLGINGKAQYRNAQGEPFKCELLRFEPRVRFSLEQLLEGFQLELTQPRVRAESRSIKAEEVARRAQEFEELRADIERLGLMMKRHANHAGRWPIICPWFESHTGKSKTGSYLVEPNERNNWAGSFVCFHSTTHQDNNHLRDIKSWLNEVHHNIHAQRAHAANTQAISFEELRAASADSSHASAMAGE